MYIQNVQCNFVKITTSYRLLYMLFCLNLYIFCWWEKKENEMDLFCRCRQEWTSSLSLLHHLQVLLGICLQGVLDSTSFAPSVIAVVWDRPHVDASGKRRLPSAARLTGFVSSRRGAGTAAGPPVLVWGWCRLTRRAAEVTFLPMTPQVHMRTPLCDRVESEWPKWLHALFTLDLERNAVLVKNRSSIMLQRQDDLRTYSFTNLLETLYKTTKCDFDLN